MLQFETNLTKLQHLIPPNSILWKSTEYSDISVKKKKMLLSYFNESDFCVKKYRKDLICLFR
jgi:hypothetical protein